jgi:hypothetical protein
MKLLPSGTKDVFDIDVIAGLIVAEIIIYSVHYLTNKIDTTGTLNAQPIPWVNYNMILQVALPLIIALVTKGRIRKVMIYAFWFSLAINANMYLWSSGTLKI